MAIIALTGAEAGSTIDFSTSGNVAIDSTTKRTGEYSVRMNNSGAAGFFQVRGVAAATGLEGNFNSVSLWTGFAFRMTSLPNTQSGIVNFATATTKQLEVRISTGGVLTTHDSAGTQQDSGSTLSTGTWYYIEVRHERSNTGAFDVRIDGVSDMSGTCDQDTSGTNAVMVSYGDASVSRTADWYYDDCYVSDSAFQATSSAFPEIRMLRPNAAGDSAGWTNGTGNTFAECDEVPPGSDGTEDTTYIGASSTMDNLYTAFNMESTATRGITGTIIAIQGMTRARTESTTGTSVVNRVRLRANSTNDDTDTPIELTTSYATARLISENDHGGSGAWTTTDLDSIQVGISAAALAQNQRCTSIYLHVLALVEVAPAITDVETDEDVTNYSHAITITGTTFGTTSGLNGKVELADNATYASATNIVRQGLESWSDTAIDIYLTRGIDTTNEIAAGTMYVFVTNNSGFRNSTGFAITVNEGAFAFEDYNFGSGSSSTIATDFPLTTDGFSHFRPGDLVIAAVLSDATSFTDTPDGWNSIAGSPFVQDVGAHRYLVDVAWRVLEEGDEDSPPAWTPASSTTYYWIVTGYHYTYKPDPIPTVGIDEEAAQNDAISHAGIVIARSNSALQFIVFNDADTDYATIAGFTQIHDPAGGRMSLYHDLTTTPGATGTVACTATNPEYGASVLIEIATEAGAGFDAALLEARQRGQTEPVRMPQAMVAA